MKFNDRTEADFVIIEIVGKIMGGEETTEYHGMIYNRLQQGYRKFIVDLSRVDWMNSTGMGMLISSLTTVKKAGGKMVFNGITDKIESQLVISRLITIFDIYDNTEEAKNSFE